MEEEEPSSELINSTTIVEVSTPKDVGEDDLVSLDKTIQIENSSLKTSPREPVEATNPPENLDNKRRKVKEEKPHSKIVVRRLPPTMTKEMFLDQVSPLPEVDYMYYIQGDTNNGFNPFSRAYLNFINQDDLFSFSRTFDNYVFLDAKGQEYPAVVEFAMFQRVPKQRPKKKDPLMGTIESDPTYITFKENLLAEALENSKTGGKAVKQHYFETEISTAEEVNTTPLLEFLKVRRAEKARIREERREEKKRKELERKLKQKTKDKKGEGDDEEPSKEAKIQHKPSEKDPAKEVNIERNKQVGDNEKLGKESFDKSNVNFKKESSEKPTILQDQKFLIFNKSDKVEQQNENESQSKDAEVQKIKEAEQQTMYLRKLLGLLPSDSQLSASKKEVSDKTNDKNSSNDDITSSVKNVCIPEQLKQATEPPEEVLSAFKENISVNQSTNIFWSKNNINPALPSASFKTSNSSAQDMPAELRSLSAPRELRESKDFSNKTVSELGKNFIKGASSTPNVSLIQASSKGALYVTKLLRKNSLKSSTEASKQKGEEVNVFGLEEKGS
ncbi:regulator of nonsense transcripts 3A isoform X5 [Halyomorpha halys]|uniref:regulator of nonsense transcripts 3A isoform X5 n=1 Tax=Halyomorpha halys TaxID=286706 RepID=UPI0034D1E14B